MEEHRRDVGQRLAELIDASDFDNYEDFAHEAGVSIKTVSRIVNGRNDARADTVRKLANALEVEPVAIIGSRPAPLGLGAGDADQAEEITAVVAAMLERLDSIDEKLARLLPDEDLEAAAEEQEEIIGAAAPAREGNGAAAPRPSAGTGRSGARRRPQRAGTG